MASISWTHPYRAEYELQRKVLGWTLAANRYGNRSQNYLLEGNWSSTMKVTACYSSVHSIAVACLSSLSKTPAPCQIPPPYLKLSPDWLEPPELQYMAIKLKKIIKDTSKCKQDGCESKQHTSHTFQTLPLKVWIIQNYYLKYFRTFLNFFCILTINVIFQHLNT